MIIRPTQQTDKPIPRHDADADRVPAGKESDKQDSVSPLARKCRRQNIDEAIRATVTQHDESLRRLTEMGCRRHNTEQIGKPPCLLFRWGAAV